MKIKQKMSSIALGLIASVLVSVATLQAATPPTPSDLPMVTLLATDPTALAGTSSGAFTLIRSGASDTALLVFLGISGTASNGVDYVTITNEVTIPKGYLAVDIPIQPIVVQARRGNKTVVLTLQTNADYLLSSGRRGTVQIVDDSYNVLPPTVSLTSPTNGSVFDARSTITLTADASDVDVAIKSVSFYAGDDFLGSTTNKPYSLSWTNVPVGKYALFARAVDQVGQSTLSAAVNISVTNEVPTIKLTSPTNGENFVVQSPIPFAAAISADTVRVQFFANGRLVGSVTNSPTPATSATFTWTNAPAGLYFLQGEAFDAAGTRGISKPVTINVSRH